MPRVLQITDCHLFADPAAELRGVSTWQRLRGLLDVLRRHADDCERLIITGDTAHDEAAPTYDAFRDALAEWHGRVLIVPGNHDDRAALQAAFPDSCRPQGDRLVFDAPCGRWRLLGLDSQVTGSLIGELGPAQRAWLASRLDDEPNRPAALFVHHPPVSVGSPSLDAIGLRDRDELADLLKSRPQVRLILCGHVHQEAAGSLARAAVFTTPAVGPQFRPRTDQIEIDPLPPAYRLLELEPDSQWTTQVLR